MKNYTLTVVLFLLCCSPALGETRDTTVCDGAFEGISSRGTYPIKVYKGDTPSAPILQGTEVEITYRLEDSVYYIHFDDTGSVEDDLWLIIRVISPPDAVFHYELNDLQIVCYSTDTSINHHAWILSHNGAISSFDTFKYTFEEYGKYIVMHYSYDSLGCGGYASDTFMVIPDSAIRIYGCEGQQLTLYGDSDTSTTHVYLKDSLHPIVVTGYHTFPSKANTDYYLRIIPHDTSKEDTWVVLEIRPRPNAYFSYTVNGFNVTFNPATNVKVPPLWVLGDNKTSGAIGSFTHTYAAPGEYIVKHYLTDTMGCQDTHTETILVPSGVDSSMPAYCHNMPISMSANGILTLYRHGDSNILDQGRKLNYTAMLSDYKYFIHLEPDDTTIPEKWYLININPLPDASFTYSLNGLTATITPAYKGSNSTEWFINDSSLYPQIGTFTHTFSSPGYYKVMHRVTDTVGCSATYIDTIAVQVSASPLKDFNTSTLHIYPNPTAGETFVTLELQKDTHLSIEIADLNGRRIQTALATKQYSPGKHDINLNTTSLDKGVYFIRTNIGSDKHYHRLIKL